MQPSLQLLEIEVEMTKNERAILAEADKWKARAEAAEADWVEDKGHENGNYQCFCTTCRLPFFGHKRRVTCKACDTREACAKVADRLAATKAVNNHDQFIKGCRAAYTHVAAEIRRGK
jgi:hypothetical protein